MAFTRQFFPAFESLGVDYFLVLDGKEPVFPVFAQSYDHWIASNCNVPEWKDHKPHKDALEEHILQLLKETFPKVVNSPNADWSKECLVLHYSKDRPYAEVYRSAEVAKRFQDALLSATNS